jgi:methyl-accepting chemotaxis protein
MSESNKPVNAPGGPPKRRLRNYLLDTRFQLKYTAYVVGVTLLVAIPLAGLAYRKSQEQTEMLSINMAMSGAAERFIAQTAAEYDHNMLMAIIGGVTILTLALGLTGILVTHRVVGPAYKMKLLFQDVADGRLRIKGRLRKHDELQDVFLAFETMIEKLRQNQRDEIDLLGRAIDGAKQAGAGDDALRELHALKARMEKELE